MRRRFPTKTVLAGTALTLAIASGPSLIGWQAMAASSQSAAHHKPRVLLVCNGSTAPCPALPASAGHYYATVQGAVNAARSGDWILVYPGVYHEKSKQWPTAGVWVSKPDIHIRGLNRDRVIIDGSNGTAAHPCPSSPAEQDFAGRDGIVVWRASGVTIENLTVCDYLSTPSGAHGNEIWWNGGDGTGKIFMGAYAGSYLTATSMYGPASNVHAPGLAMYGIFVSNSRGPGMITNSYASNMADSAYYIGACRRECNMKLVHDEAVNSALGYSGTNAGGRLIIADSVFTHNHTGLAPNSLNNDDAPPPQDGRCPANLAQSCMVIEHDVIANNNNPNTPISGIEPIVGTGVELTGSAYDTVRDNLIVNNGAYGVIAHDYPDPETPPKLSHCQGGIKNDPFPGYCLFPARGNLIYGNTFVHDGYFGNATNSDLATETLGSYTPRNCFFGNVVRTGKLTSSPGRIQLAKVDGPPCGLAGTGNIPALFDQLICATGFLTCPLPPSKARYPAQTRIDIRPLPRLATMPDPCKGVPRNAFCPEDQPGSRAGYDEADTRDLDDRACRTAPIAFQRSAPARSRACSALV